MNLTVNRLDSGGLPGPPGYEMRRLEFQDQGGQQLGCLDWTSGEVQFSGDPNRTGKAFAELLQRLPVRTLHFIRTDGTAAAVLDWSTGKVVFSGSADHAALVLMKWVRLHLWCADPNRN